MIDELLRVLVRDLAAMRREVEAYARDEDLWAAPAGITNPGGNLALHVAGNLRHFVGSVLGGNGYVQGRAVPRAEILAALDAASVAVREALPGLSPEALAAPYPVDLGGTRLSTRQFLVHLATHLAYHVGQVDYHRRLVTGGAATVNALSIAALTEGE